MKRIIKESSITDNPVRQIVKSMVDIVKSRKTGTYYLPEDITDGEDMEYNFKKIPFFNIEFIYDENLNINEEYLIDGELYSEELTIAIKLILNPKHYPQNMYDIIADLNDVVSHELEHVFQEVGKRPKDEIDMYPTDIKPQGKDYYLQSHEIPAQFKGFRRVSKLRKEKIKKTLRDWFKRNQSVNKLSDSEIRDITTHLSKIFKEKYGR